MTNILIGIAAVVGFVREVAIPIYDFLKKKWEKRRKAVDAAKAQTGNFGAMFMPTIDSRSAKKLGEAVGHLANAMKNGGKK